MAGDALEMLADHAVGLFMSLSMRNLKTTKPRGPRIWVVFDVLAPSCTWAPGGFQNKVASARWYSTRMI